MQQMVDQVLIFNPIHQSMPFDWRIEAISICVVIEIYVVFPVTLFL
jgi:hypothetical protein